jgi:hypothetical protein
LKRFRKAIVFGAVLGVVTAITDGCSDGTAVKLEEAPPVKAPPPKEVPKDPRQGGGPGSSGHMTKNPGGNS